MQDRFKDDKKKEYTVACLYRNIRQEKAGRKDQANEKKGVYTSPLFIQVFQSMFLSDVSFILLRMEAFEQHAIQD